MITWNKTEIANFFDIEWSLPFEEETRFDATVRADAFALSISVFPFNDSIELRIKKHIDSTQEIASWTMECDSIEVLDLRNEGLPDSEPFVKFQNTESKKESRYWITISKSPDSDFSIHTSQISSESKV